MKLSCEIVKDLLPLYEDAICSKESRDVVEEHLKECSDCRNLVQHIQILSKQEMPVSAAIEDRAIVKSFRKIRHRWAVSLIAMFLVLPVIFLSINQARGMGVCYTNIDEIVIARQFVQALEKEDFQIAAELLNYEDTYQQIQIMLEKNVDAYMPDFIPVTIGQDEWMANEDVYQRYFNTEQVNNQFWKDVVFDDTSFIIPIDIWNDIVLEQPDSFVEIDGDFILAEEMEEAGEPYVRMETQWGTYMVRQHRGLLECTSADEFCIIAGLVPIAMYQEGVTIMEKEAMEIYQNTLEHYEEVSGMTEVEFCELMQERRIQKLEECAEAGFRFKNSGLEKCEYDDAQRCWSITYGVEVAYQGKDYSISILMDIVNNNIVHMNMSWSREFSEGDMLNPILSTYYIQ